MIGEKDKIKLIAVLAMMIPLFFACQQPELDPMTPERAFGDPERGQVAIRQYACHGCHVIPGIVGPKVRVGPILKKIAGRQYLAGVLPNTPENMIFWLRNPKQVDPLTAMPNMGVTEADARDIAAYLYTLQ